MIRPSVRSDCATVEPNVGSPSVHWVSLPSLRRSHAENQRFVLRQPAIVENHDQSAGAMGVREGGRIDSLGSWQEESLEGPGGTGYSPGS